MPICSPTRRVAFVHLPKTAGSWVTEALRELEGDPNLIRHLGSAHARLRAHHPGRGWRIFGTLRNPWDWYGSVYAHGMRLEARRECVAQMGGGSEEFRDVLWGMTHGRSADLSGVMWDAGPVGDPSEGLYTRACRWLYEPEAEDPPVAWWIATDRAREGLAEFLGAEVRTKPINACGLGVYADWYDAEMAGWVAAADPALVAWGGWALGEPTSWTLRADAPDWGVV